MKKLFALILLLTLASASQAQFRVSVGFGGGYHPAFGGYAYHPAYAHPAFGHPALYSGYATYAPTYSYAAPTYSYYAAPAPVTYYSAPPVTYHQDVYSVPVYFSAAFIRGPLGGFRLRVGW